MLGTGARIGLIIALLTAAAPVPHQRWTGAYGAPPIGYEPAIRDALPQPLHDQTVRQSVRVSVAGHALRVRLSNELGTTSLRIGGASIARLDARGQVVPGSTRPLLFAGQPAITIPAGAPWLTDPVPGPVSADADYAVTLYFPEQSSPAAHAQMVEVAPGNQTGRDGLASPVRARTAGLVSAIEVETAAAQHVLVTFGDSITEGAASTPGGHMSWPDQLGRMLARTPAGRCWAISNAGISGNRLLHDGRAPNALARFDRDVLSVPGATAVVLLEGINDIGASHMPEHASESVSADAIIAGMRELVERAHARGLRVIGGTLLPYQGAAYADAGGEAKRVAVNAWIRTGGAFDAVIDFDAAMGDPAHPDRMIEAGNSGDHLHPNDRGYTRMAEAALPTILKEGCPTR